MINIQGPVSEINKLLEQQSLNNLGEIYFTDLLELLYLVAPVGEVVVANNLEEVYSYVQNMSGRYGIYVTGGFESWHHVMLLWNLKHQIPNSYFILGLNTSRYIEDKGKRPAVFFEIENKLNLWQALSPDGVIFQIPEEVERNYDDIAEKCGVLKNPWVYHLSNWDDDPEVAKARKERAVEGNFLQVSKEHSFPIHTSDLFR